MLIPLYGFVEGDTLGLLVLAHGTDTEARLIERMKQSAKPRVLIEGNLFVEFDGKRLAADETLAHAGITPLCRVDLRRSGNGGKDNGSS